MLPDPAAMFDGSARHLTGSIEPAIRNSTKTVSVRVVRIPSSLSDAMLGRATF
jgi:hypothetical protein